MKREFLFGVTLCIAFYSLPVAQSVESVDCSQDTKDYETKLVIAQQDLTEFEIPDFWRKELDEICKNLQEGKRFLQSYIEQCQVDEARLQLLQHLLNNSKPGLKELEELCEDGKPLRDVYLLHHSCITKKIDGELLFKTCKKPFIELFKNYTVSQVSGASDDHPGVSESYPGSPVGVRVHSKGSGESDGQSGVHENPKESDGGPVGTGEAGGQTGGPGGFSGGPVRETKELCCFFQFGRTCIGNFIEKECGNQAKDFVWELYRLKLGGQFDDCGKNFGIHSAQSCKSVLPQSYLDILGLQPDGAGSLTFNLLCLISSVLLSVALF